MVSLEWSGKKAVVNHHLEVKYRLLCREPALSVGDADTGNLLIQGDNLNALKALLPYYGGQVKCIYIDPPYNTGNENWVYNDNSKAPEIQRWFGKVVGGEGETLDRHDRWLCMMYPRLTLLHQLLREDGAIFISIDDNELANLRCLLGEVFGEQNIVATLVWEKGKKGDAKFVSVTHEYVVVAVKNKSLLVTRNTKWRRRKPGMDAVLAQYQTLKQEAAGDHVEIRKRMMSWYRSLPAGDSAKAHKHYNWSDDRGLYFAADFAGPDDGRKSRPRYDIIHPVTGTQCAKPSTGWRWEEERTQRALAEKPPRIHFGPGETTIPNRKSYLFEVDSEPVQSVFYKDGRAATLEVETLLGKGLFSFPKDSEVLADLLSICTDKDSLILDSFGGSGTTGHAVMRLNAADGGRRRCILVEMEENIARNITARRLKKVIEGYGETKGLGGSFSFCTLSEPVFDAEGQVCKHVRFEDLARHVFFSETGQPLPNVTRKSPLIGEHDGTAYYLLFNGILGERSADGGNTLTAPLLRTLPAFDGPKLIFGERCMMSSERRKRERITFRQIPYEVKGR